MIDPNDQINEQLFAMVEAEHQAMIEKRDSQEEMQFEKMYAPCIGVVKNVEFTQNTWVDRQDRKGRSIPKNWKRVTLRTHRLGR